MKKKHKIKAVIFDLDGTLLDSLQDIADSMNKALADSGLPEHPLEAYKDFVGDGLFKLTERVLPASRRKKADIEAVAEKFWVNYEESWFLHTKTYPGILYLIQLCVSHKIK
ncbi:MAG TPA: HAD hydrolase-like protein, partial [Candidatus Syntrophosphaera sp.]|nr:HAD hydrolase-like protein [Candidatus Syntrophosphaera sp.]